MSPNSWVVRPCRGKGQWHGNFFASKYLMPRFIIGHYHTLILLGFMSSLQPRPYRDPSCIHSIRSSETFNGDSSTGRSHDDSHRIHEPSPAARTRSFLHFESTPSWSLGISSMEKSELPLGGAVHIGVHLVYSYTFNPRLVPPCLSSRAVLRSCGAVTFWGLVIS